ncbi:MAG: MFS transporter [Saprospiraceae bacterium]|nr:MFS transporter [Saprospiraceae bacterium]
MKRVLSFYLHSFRGLSREVWILSIVILINRSGMMVLPFLALYSTNELGFSIARAGIVTGMYGAGSLLGSWLGGMLTDRIGFYKVLSRSLILGGIGMASLIFFRDYYLLCIAVFVTSTIADASRPPLMAAISLFSKPENQTRAISLVRMALNLGISIGPAMAGFLAGNVGYNWLFILDGITCIGAALFLILQLRPDHRKTSKKSTTVNESEVTITSDWLYMVFLIVTGINIIAFIQILSTVPLFFQEELLMNETQIGIFFTFNGLLVFFFEMPLVAYSQKKWNPFTSMILGAVLISLGHLFLNLPLHWILVVAGYNFLVSFGEIINFPFGNSLSLARAPDAQKGKYMGLWAMMFSSAFIIAPILGTQLVEASGFFNTWFIIAGMSFAMVPGFIWIRRRWSLDTYR